MDSNGTILLTLMQKVGEQGYKFKKGNIDKVRGHLVMDDGFVDLYFRRGELGQEQLRKWGAEITKKYVVS